MKRTIQLILLLAGLLPLTALNAQDFPESWTGHWAGTVEIWNQNTLVDSLPMSLTISPTDSSCDWTLVYDRVYQGQIDQRNYSLITINDSTGHYAIDEHNDIILDSYLYGDCFYSSFYGRNTDLMMRICRVGPEELSYEITSAHSEPVRTSGAPEELGGEALTGPGANETRLGHC